MKKFNVKHFVFKCFLTIVMLTLLNVAFQYYYESISSEQSADIAIRQFEDTTQANRELRQHQITKNNVHVFQFFGNLGILLFMFSGDVGRGAQYVYKKCTA